MISETKLWRAVYTIIPWTSLAEASWNSIRERGRKGRSNPIAASQIRQFALNMRLAPCALLQFVTVCWGGKSVNSSNEILKVSLVMKLESHGVRLLGRLLRWFHQSPKTFTTIDMPQHKLMRCTISVHHFLLICFNMVRFTRFTGKNRPVFF